MKIGIDARLPYYRLGGISRYVIQLIKALAEQDHENHYVAFQSRKDTNTSLTLSDNFERSDLWTPCHHRLERYALSFELAFHSLDIMHSPDFIPPWRGAAKHVVTVHDLNFLYYPQFLTGGSRRYYASQIRWAVDHADRIIADSEHTRRDLIAELSVPPHKVQTIYLAADPQFAAIAKKVQADEIDQTLSRFNLRSGYILFVGTLEPRKNIPTLLGAYERLRTTTSLNPQLALVGSRGWMYEDIFEAIGKLQYASDVHHLSDVTDVELAHLYAAAGVLALPSYYEGFGLPVLEAMHCGCPVVASNRASLPEVVGSAGLLLDADDNAAWVATILRVLSDDILRKRMVAAGVSWAQQFSWRRTAEATRSVYEQLS